MFILEEQSCGWIPNATINFIANIVDIIKIFVPILLVIMGAIEFGKAVMAQQEDQIKKSQTAFIQKVIAGAAVFFVIALIGWILEIISNADSSLNANNALQCMTLMFNGGYNADTIDPMKPPSLVTTTKTTTTTTTIDYEKFNFGECKNACSDTASTTAKAILIKMNLNPAAQLAMLPSMTAKIKEECMQKCESINENMISTFPNLFKKQQQDTAQCMNAARCTSVDNCLTCIENNEVERYKYTKKKGSEVCSANRPYDNDNTYLDSCMKDFGYSPEIWEKDTLYNKCSPEQNLDVLIRGDEAKKSCCLKIKDDIDKEIQKEYGDCLEDYTKTVKTNLVNWYCTEFPNEC